MTNGEALQKALMTSDLTTGLLSDAQAREFIRQVFQATPMLQSARTVMMGARRMNIDKIGIGKRLLRKRPEGTNFTTFTKPSTSQVQLSAVDLQLPWEITEEVIRYNLEGERFEETVIALMTQQVGVDLCDLAWNGDTTDPSPTTITSAMSATNPGNGGTLNVASTTGYPENGTLVIDQERIQYEGKTATSFKNILRGADGTTPASHSANATIDLATDGLLTATDGWLRKANQAGRTLDGSTVNGGSISKEHFAEALKLLPSKYLTGGTSARFRWIMHPRQRVNWLTYLASRNTGAGDSALLGPSGAGQPYGWPILEDAALPTGTIVFTDPQNLIIGMSQDILIKRDTSSKEVISRGVRYYQVDLAVDVQVEEPDAIVKIINLV